MLRFIGSVTNDDSARAYVFLCRWNMYHRLLPVLCTILEDSIKGGATCSVLYVESRGWCAGQCQRTISLKCSICRANRTHRTTALSERWVQSILFWCSARSSMATIFLRSMPMTAKNTQRKLEITYLLWTPVVQSPPSAGFKASSLRREHFKRSIPSTTCCFNTVTVQLVLI